jgi:hypothetical protein
MFRKFSINEKRFSLKNSDRTTIPFERNNKLRSVSLNQFKNYNASIKRSENQKKSTVLYDLSEEGEENSDQNQEENLNFNNISSKDNSKNSSRLSSSLSIDSSSNDDKVIKYISDKPRFGSYLSKDGQFAIIQSLEDKIEQEMHLYCSELCKKLKRCSTAQYFQNRSEINKNEGITNTSIMNHDGSMSKDHRIAEHNEYLAEELVEIPKGLQTVSTRSSEYVKRMEITQKIDLALTVLDHLASLKKNRDENKRNNNEHLKEKLAISLKKYNQFEYKYE